MKDINTYMASYKQKLSLAKEKLDIIQGQIQGQLFSQILFDQDKQLLLEVQKWSNIEEKVLKQIARATWIEHGDANTKYFHAQWKIRTIYNAITSIYP